MFYGLFNGGKQSSSIVLRLSLLYAAISALSFLIIFFLLYTLAAKHIYQTKDHWLREEAKELERAICSSHTPEQIQQHITTEAEFAGANRVFYCLRKTNGAPLAFSNPRFFPNILDNQEFFLWQGGTQKKWVTQELDEQIYRVLYLPINNGKWVIQCVASLQEDTEFINYIVSLCSVTYLVIVGVVWIMGFFLVKKALQPVHTISRIAQEFSVRNLDQRIPIQDTGDELVELAKTINQMLDKIERLMTEMKKMNENLTHDLRTLISRMRVSSEIALMNQRSSAEYQRVLENSLADYDYLLNTLNTLLDISEVETGLLKIDHNKVLIEELLDKAVEMFSPVALYHQIALIYEKTSLPCILGDGEKIQQVIFNLLDNAIKYTPANGKIFLAAGQNKDRLYFMIRDTGVGIPSDCLSYIFKRFYRSDSARRLPGSGLGLSLAHAIVEAHHGEIAVESVVGKGTSFTVFLPRLSTSSN